MMILIIHHFNNHDDSYVNVIEHCTPQNSPPQKCVDHKLISYRCHHSHPRQQRAITKKNSLQPTPPPVRTRISTFTESTIKITESESKTQENFLINSPSSTSRLSTATFDNQQSSSPRPSITIDNNNKHSEVLIIHTPRANDGDENDPDLFLSAEELQLEYRARLLVEANSVIGEFRDDPTTKRRSRGLLMSKLKSADRERAAMTRDLYEEVLMALQVQQEEEEQRKREDRADREKDEEKKRKRQERYQQKEEERAIKFTHPTTMMKILDTVNNNNNISSSLTLPPVTPPSANNSSINNNNNSNNTKSSSLSSSFDSFISSDIYESQYFGFDSDNNSPVNNIRTVEWLHPPHLPYNLHHSLKPSEFPSYIHSDVDVIDPSGQSIHSLLLSWLEQYHNERNSFTSPIINS